MTAGERIGRQLIRRTPTWALLTGGAILGAGRVLRWLAVHTAVAAALALVVLTWWAIDRGWWPWLAAATGLICLGLGGVMELRPYWWTRLTTAVASRRRLAWYRARWEPAMVGSGLTLADDVPQLVGHRFGGQPGERDLDVLLVSPVPGQVLEDWRHVSSRLAAAWGRTRVRVHPVRVGYADRWATAPAMLELSCSSRPPAAARRAAVAGGQVPLRVETRSAEELDAHFSTPVDRPVDQPFDDPSAGDPTDVAPPGAFPRTPRADR